jgi:uncharacterized protein YydD (DUF2326 family)
MEACMSYWTEVKEVFLKGIDLAVDGIKEGAATIVLKGKEGVQYAQLKKDLFLQHRTLHDTLADLGDAVNESYKEKKDLYTDAKIKSLIGKVKSIEDECRKIEKEIGSIGMERKAG